MKIRLLNDGGFHSLEGVDLTDKVFDAIHVEATKYSAEVITINHKDLVDAGMDDWGVVDTYPINFFPDEVIVIEE